MVLVAEYVSKGHPDRICDNIVNNIVNYVTLLDKRALCALECAIFQNEVFIDGRIAIDKRQTITKEEINQIILDTYEKLGFGRPLTKIKPKLAFLPFRDEININNQIVIDAMGYSEKVNRIYSDDQNVVNGYALNLEASDYLPVEHYVASKIGEEFEKFVARPLDDDENIDEATFYGNDYKILVQIKKEDDKYTWERLTMYLFYRSDKKEETIYFEVLGKVKKILKKLFADSPFGDLMEIEQDNFYLNLDKSLWCGPYKDNGLSGKKLCLDFYGPSIPIGGGAIYGKDIYKIDVCGAFKARKLALDLVKKYNFYSVFTTLARSPLEEEPYIIEAYSIDELGTKLQIDESFLPPKNEFSIKNINLELSLNNRKIQKIKDIK